MIRTISVKAGFLLVAAAVVCTWACYSADAQPRQSSQAPAAANPQGSTPASAAGGTTSTPYHNQPPRVSRKAGMIYESVWGIDALSVKAVESGEILRFSYRVLDPEKAKPLNDKKVDPYLVCPFKGVKLIIPTMEKVGQLRQTTSNPEAGKSYWMAFSDSGRLIRKGDHVDVVIGNFHAEDLVVE